MYVSPAAPYVAGVKAKKNNVEIFSAAPPEGDIHGYLFPLNLTRPPGVDKNERKFVVDGLRRLWLRWPARTKVKQAARVARGKYQCAGCDEIVSAGKITVDHVEPCVDPEMGFQDWNTFVSRLLCPRENLQCLCKTCHSKKSKAENARRREVARENKPKATKRTSRRKKTKDAGPPQES